MMRLITTLLFLPASAVAFDAPGFVSTIFGSNQVFQHSDPLTIFGWASSPSVPVSVTLTSEDGTTVTTAAANSSSTAYNGAYYRWDLTLPASPPSLSPYSLSVESAETSETASLTNILFGDVYLCSGQSNMQFSVEGMLGKDEEIKAADDYGYIRMVSGCQGGVEVTENHDIHTHCAPLFARCSLEWDSQRANCQDRSRLFPPLLCPGR